MYARRDRGRDRVEGAIALAFQAQAGSGADGTFLLQPLDPGTACSCGGPSSKDGRRFEFRGVPAGPHTVFLFAPGKGRTLRIARQILQITREAEQTLALAPPTAFVDLAVPSGE